MPELLQLNPPGLAALFRPGNPFAVVATWSTGALAGRTFTSSLGAQALTVDVVGDVMTITATVAQTSALGDGNHTFLLVDTTGDGTNEILAGAWTGTDNAAAATTKEVVVTTSIGSVEVDVSGQAGLTAHVSSFHTTPDLRTQSPAAWAERLFFVDAVNCPATALSFEHGQAVMRGSGAGTGVQSARRSAFLIPGSPRGYSRMLSRWSGPALPVGLLAQHGHMHGLGTQADGKRRAVVVWHDVLFSAPQAINLGVWESNPDGTGFVLPSGAAPDDFATFTGGSRTANVVTLTGLPAGHGFVKDDVVTVDAADNGYDGTFPVASAASTSITYNQTAADDASSGSGTVTLARSGIVKAGLARGTTVTVSSRTAGLVTVTVAAGHPFQVGDPVLVDLADATYDGVHRVTEVLTGPDRLRWRQPVADDVDGGTGAVTKVLPYWVESIWSGTVLRVRVWPDVGVNGGSSGALPAGPPPWESAWATAQDLSGLAVPMDPAKGEGCALLAAHLAAGSTVTEVRYDAIETTLT